MKKVGILMVVLATVSARAYSQDSTNALEGVVVHETRIPTTFSESTRSITVVDKQQILNSNATNLNEVLTYVSGLDLRQRGPNNVQADVGVRGGSFDQTLVLINGMKVSDPQTGHHNLNLPINWSNVERIEVLKGPGARIYGPNAYSGAINIVTKPGKDKEIFVAATAGSHQLHEVTASVQVPIKNYKQFISLSASGSDSFRYNTDFKIRNVLYQGQLDKGANKVDVMAGYNTRKFGANSFYVSSASNEQYEETEAFFGSLRYTREISKKIDFRATSYFRHHNDHYVFIRDNPSVYENFHTTQVAALELNSTIKTKIGHFNVGIDGRSEQIESNNLGDRNRTLLGGYVDYKTVVGKKFIINPGFNVTAISGYDPVFYPGFDIGYLLNEKMTLFANSGASFRVPTYTDLYYAGPDNLGNENLVPEQAWTHEIGLKRLGKWNTLSSSLFYRKANNAIEWVRENDSARWQPRNFLEVSTYGFEVESKWDVSSKSNFFNFVGASYTFLNSDFDVNSDLDSKYQLQFIKHQAILTVNHDIVGPVKHQFSVRLIERYGVTPYTLVDTRVYMSLKKISVFAEVSNLLNTDYNEAGFVTMPGRWFRAGVRVKI